MPYILIIDDSATMRLASRRPLEEAGFEVFEAADGDEGMAFLRKSRVDVVITDIFMPVKDGLETIREIRTLFPEIKILAISGKTTGALNYLEVAEKLGADESLAKPVDGCVLVATVRRLLQREAPS